MDPLPDAFAMPEQVANWLSRQRNDLEAPAIAIAPAVATAMDAIRLTGPRLTRMSGSGATCFGLFDSLPAADVAAKAVRRDHSDWWVQSAPILS